MDPSNRLLNQILRALKDYWQYVAISVGFFAVIRCTSRLLRANRGRKLSLLNRTVAITGASSGLGKELAIKCYCEGAKVILLARRVEELKKICDELKGITSVKNKNEPAYAYLDMTDVSDATVNSILDLAPSGTIDVLINNAGISMRGSCDETTVEVHRKVMETNYFGHVALTKGLLDKIPHDGAIVVTNSIQGKLAVPYRSAYSASKHAIQAFFDSLRCEKGPEFHILSVFAAYMKTSLGRHALTVQGEPMKTDDPDQMKGLDPAIAANKIYKALIDRQTELTLAPLSYRLAIFLRWLCPDLVFYILYRRSKNSPFAKKTQ